MIETTEYRRFLDDLAETVRGDYATGFKILGFLLYVAEYGVDDFLAGEMISPRTYYRWVVAVKKAGWESLLSDVRFGQALREYIASLEGQPDTVRQTVLSKLDEVMSEEVKNAELAA